MADATSVPEIPFEVDTESLDFHPTRDVVAVGLISGQVACHSYAPGTARELIVLEHHKKACRAVKFSSNGDALYSVSRDRSLCGVDVSTGNIFWRQSHAHGAPINSMITFDEHYAATGDDKGRVKVWDIRTNKGIHSFTENEDFISDMVVSENDLLCASGDGTLAVYNWKMGSVRARSENFEDELLSLAVVKNRKKVVCGTQDGILNIFSYGSWEDLSDRFPGHPSSVESLIVVDEDTVLTASSDGLIRVVSILPNKLLGVIGEHGDYPIERMALSHDDKYLASSSHDNVIRFWDVEYLFEGDEDGDNDEMDDEWEEIEQPMEAKRKEKKEGKKGKKAVPGFFSGL